MSEFDFIRDLRPLTDLDPALGLADDAALVPAQADVVCCDTLVEGIKIARKICNTSPVKELITAEFSPGDEVGDDDAAILEWARNSATTIYHPTGTCKMGSDKMAVVDARLKVYGVSGLRVADASVMPVITSGNTNAPAIMIGEKLSDMVLQDAAKR